MEILVDFFFRFFKNYQNGFISTITENRLYPKLNIFNIYLIDGCLQLKSVPPGYQKREY